MNNRLTQVIVGKKNVTEKKNFVWNMIGSGIFSFVSMALSLCVIQIAGEKVGGVFSIAVTISQMMLYIAFFELRTFLVTDTNRKYTFSQYHGAKILTCTAMMLVSIAYVLVKKYVSYKAVVIILMCLYRMIDGYADIYEGEFQLDGKLYLSGKSMTFRSVLSAIALIVTLATSKSIVLSIFSAIIVSLICVIIFNINIAKYYGEIKPDCRWNNVKSILYECFPFFIGAFLWVYILSASRIAVDNNMSSQSMSYYQVLFMPVSIVNLFATFFFRPALTSLSELYYGNEEKKFIKKIVVLLTMIMAFTVICVIGAYILGIPALSLISGCDLHAYRKLLIILMIAGGINSASFFMYYILTIMRKAKSILIGYITSAIITAVISNKFVEMKGLEGAAFSFLVTVIYLFLYFMISFVRKMIKRSKNHGRVGN